MLVRAEIQYGQDLVSNLEDDSGAVDLTGSTVVLQTRTDCGAITEYPAVLSAPVSGEVTASNLPVGHYHGKWKVTFSGGAVVYFPDYGWNDLVVRPIDDCLTFELFVSQAAETVFPEGEPENLLRSHRKYVVDALIDLQQKVPSSRTNHRDRIFPGNTVYTCGASIVNAPRGFITRIYAVRQDACCTRRTFDPIEPSEMDCFLKDQRACGYVPTFSDTDIYGYESDYGCAYYADPSGATDLPCHPVSGVVALENSELRVYPWLQSDEVLVIEWDGIKRAWKDTDEVTFDREIADAVEHYLASKTAKREDADKDRMLIERNDYMGLVAKLIWQERAERRIKTRSHCFSNCWDFANATPCSTC